MRAGQGPKAGTVLLSPETMAKQEREHGELTNEEYALVQKTILQGEVIQEGNFNLIYTYQEGKQVVVIKAKRSGDAWKGLKGSTTAQRMQGRRGKDPEPPSWPGEILNRNPGRGLLGSVFSDSDSQTAMVGAARFGWIGMASFSRGRPRSALVR